MTSSSSRIAFFGTGHQNVLPADMYGNKAAGLAVMSSAGIPVPPGFVLPVGICQEYYRNGDRLPDDVPALLMQGISYLEKATGCIFGGLRKPLLVSVRSGAPVSMPGIMDTILNVGLTPVTVRALLLQTGNPRFVYDTYRRFLENYGTSILSHSPKIYAQNLKGLMKKEGISDERELDYQNLKTLCLSYEQEYGSEEHRMSLVDVWRQLSECVTSVLRSFDSPRANLFKSTRLAGEVPGTAVTVQAMVFGNMGASSGAGVAFTRNPWTGVREMLVDFRFGGQGEDVVSGDREAMTQAELAQVMPDVYRDLVQIGSQLEKQFYDMQDIEFTVQEGRLYILQSRPGKRAPLASFKIALDMCDEGIIERSDLRDRLRDIDPHAIFMRTVESGIPPLTQGTPASGGVASGTVALSSERAEQDAPAGPVILVRETASPDDIAGIDVSAGILTCRGARTSHAAVVARQMGKVCVVNCTDLLIDIPRHSCRIGGTVIREGETISIDGNSGAVYTGTVVVRSKRPDDLLKRLAELKCQPATG